MNNIMMLDSAIIIYSLLFLGVQMDRWWGLSRHYISPALAGGTAGMIFLLIGFYTTGFSWTPSEQLTHLLVTSFLFFVGVKIGFIYKKRHILLVICLLLLAFFSILLLDSLAWIFFRQHALLRQLAGSSTLAWNQEWMDRIRFLLPANGTVQVMAQTSLLLAFLFSPIIIRLMRSFSPPESRIQTRITTKKRHIFAWMLQVIITVIAVWLKHIWLSSSLFLFDFVLSMIAGVLIGLWLRNTGWARKHHFLETIQEIGTLSLYGLIIAMILSSFAAILIGGLWMVTVIELIKILLISLLFVGIAQKWGKNHPRLVLLSACWSFTLSAPIACMNAMRSIVNRHGEADDVLFIVPPVVLWLINYPHYALFVWMNRF